MDKVYLRNLAILQARKEGKTFQQIANEFHITRSRVQQITKAGHALGKTASLLSDSDELMPATRALLARHGYSTRPAVIQAVQNGLLHAGCFFGMGEKRFLEIQKWCE